MNVDYTTLWLSIDIPCCWPDFRWSVVNQWPLYHGGVQASAREQRTVVRGERHGCDVTAVDTQPAELRLKTNADTEKIEVKLF